MEISTDKTHTREQQAKLIWKQLNLTELKQSEKNVACKYSTIMSPTLHSDFEMTARLREDISHQIPAVIREIRPGSVLVQKGQLITVELAKLLRSQGYPDAKYPWKTCYSFCYLAWSFGLFGSRAD